MVIADRIQAACEADEIAWNELRTLVEQLIEGMLAVGARLPPNDRPRLAHHRPALAIDALAVALHVELLQVGAEAPQILVVGEDRAALRAHEIVVPQADHGQQHG